jgi:hypothetical protein
LAHSKPALHPLFSQILTDFVQQAELQALPTCNEIYLEFHESHEDLGIKHDGYAGGEWF